MYNVYIMYIVYTLRTNANRSFYTMYKVYIDYIVCMKKNLFTPNVFTLYIVYSVHYVSRGTRRRRRRRIGEEEEGEGGEEEEGEEREEEGWRGGSLCDGERDKEENRKKMCSGGRLNLFSLILSINLNGVRLKCIECYIIRIGMLHM